MLLRAGVRFCAAALAVAVAAAACGGGAKDNGIAKLSATAALEKVQAALSKVTSVHVTGHITTRGQDITLDLHDKVGAGSGTMKVNGGEMDLVRLDDAIYVKSDQTALTTLGAPPARASLVAGKWLRASISARGPFSSLADLLDTTALFANVTSPQGQLKMGTTTTIDGRKVCTLIDVAPDGNGTLYVATTGEPLPIRVDQPGSNGGTLDFVYGGSFDITAPSGAVDLSQLTGP